MVAKKRCCKTQYFVFYMTIAQQVGEPKANCTAKAEEHNKRVTFYKNAVCLMVIIFPFMALTFAKGSKTMVNVYVVCNPPK